MQYTSSEIAAWRKVSHFFETYSVLDIDACSTYLQAYLKRPNNPVAISDEEYNFFVVLIKKAVDLPESGAAFARLYNAPRSDGARIQGNDGARLQQCLSDLSESHPHVLRRWLKAVSLEADITNQILLIRDVKQWLPNDDVGDYLNASTLKMKPAAFVKKFTPDVCDMQCLLAVGKELQEQTKCAHLGLLMVQGIFIAMYGKDCITNDFDGTGSNRAQPRLEVKYSARAAFGLMQKNGIAIEPRELIRIVKLRYNAESLESDALAYCYDGLKTNATPDIRVYALAVLDAVLEEQSKNPGPQYNRGSISYSHNVNK